MKSAIFLRLSLFVLTTERRRPPLLAPLASCLHHAALKEASRWELPGSITSARLEHKDQISGTRGNTVHGRAPDR